jgi:hypothetical protein
MRVDRRGVPAVALLAALALGASATGGAGCSQPRTEQFEPASRPLGAGCADNTQCESGFCPVPEGLLCGRCRPRPRVGDSCSTQLCADDQICVDGYFVCAAPSGLGDACNRRQPCADGLWCVGASVIGTTRSGRCQPVIEQPGARCDPDAQTLAGCDGAQGLYCNRETRICEVAAVTDQVGGACGPIGPTYVVCDFGLYCLRGKCTQVSDPDQPCGTRFGPLCYYPAVCHSDDTFGGGAGFCRLPGDQDCSR